MQAAGAWSSMSDVPSDPSDLSVEQARDRWLAKLTDKTDRTIRSYTDALEVDAATDDQPTDSTDHE